MLGYIKVMRPPLALMGFLAPLCIGLHYSVDDKILFLLFLSIGFGNLSFLILNEVRDYPQDKVIKPWKPIPMGEVNPVKALDLAGVFLLISLCSLLILILSDWRYVIGLLGYTTAVIYNVLKIREIFGNICLGLTYFISAFMSTGLSDLLFPLAFMILTIAHNFGVQLQDLPGDKVAGVKTAPIVIGEQQTTALSMVLSIIAGVTFIYIGQLWCIPFMFASVLVFVGVVVGEFELFIRKK